jgi:glycosyl transferase family 25
MALPATKTRNSDWTKSLVKTYILSLPSAQERREFQTQQARNLGLDAVFIDARSPADIPDAFFMAHAFSWERPLKITEVACFMSHHAVWDIIANGSEPALILEDDAILARHSPRLLKWLSALGDLDHVSLETRQRKKLIGRRSIPNAELQVSLQPLLQDRTGAAAYVLWPSGARILLSKFMQQGMGLADAFISSTYQLKSWQTLPAMAIQADMATSYGLPCPMPSHSLIAREKVPSPPTQGIGHDLLLKYRRLMGQLRLAARFLSCFWRARRQYVGIDPQTF